MSDEKTKHTAQLVTKTPCCGRPVRIMATVAVPRELFTRRCSACGVTWEVERRTAAESPGRRVDILEWTRTPHYSVLLSGNAPWVDAARAAIAKAEGKQS